MVVSNEPLATDAGVEILRAGGNAVDAAVAVGFALAVTDPRAGNIGGGGFMLIRMSNGEAVVVDYREEAPGAATRNMFLDAHGEPIPAASRVGPLAAGVPGTVAGLALAEEKYGKLGLARVLAPAIRLAGEGFPVSFALAQSLKQDEEHLSKFAESRRIFLRGGQLYEPGEMLRQPELAQTLHLIAALGPDAFYRGPIAMDIQATMKSLGGLISLDDLAHYQAKLRKPLVGQFRGTTIVTVPPPSSGGVALLEMLNVLEPLDLGAPNSFQSMHLVGEAMRRAYADRAAYMGDTDFVSAPVAGLLSPKYAAKLRDEILQGKAEAPVAAGNPAPFEAADTTHYSVADADGNAVSNTYTINGYYGSGVTVEGAGFLLNNEMDDFAAKPGTANMFGLVQGEANAVGPRKRPLSSMTPTIVLANVPPEGEAEKRAEPQVRLVLGSPGGGTIINSVLEVVLNVLVYKMDVQMAVAAPRYHDQWMPDRIDLERFGFSADTIQKLHDAGYQTKFVENLGDVDAIEIKPAGTGWRFGAADPRGDGKAAGY
jgi:gamma-glutamyltranspeptidase / glutathione hydrolase